MQLRLPMNPKLAEMIAQERVAQKTIPVPIFTRQKRSLSMETCIGPFNASIKIADSELLLGRSLYIIHSTLSSSTTVKRTIKRKGTHFDDEPKKPFLGNLSTHVRTCHPRSSPPDTNRVETSSNSTEIMENFLKRGEENPTHEPTQEGFNKVFTAWCLEMNIPFSAGESEGADRLFCYIKSRFSLPSDTMVCKKLELIHSDLRAHVLQEIKV